MEITDWQVREVESLRSSSRKLGHVLHKWCMSEMNENMMNKLKLELIKSQTDYLNSKLHSSQRKF